VEFDGAPTYYGLNAVWICDINEWHAVGEPASSVPLILSGRVSGV